MDSTIENYLNEIMLCIDDQVDETRYSKPVLYRQILDILENMHCDAFQEGRSSVCDI